jgi:outer membrane protein assembly factor BamB
LYVTGVGGKIPGGVGNGAAALNARTGATIWQVSDTAAASLLSAVLSPDAATLFAIAISHNGKATVVAYAAGTGGQLWAAPVTSTWGRLNGLAGLAETSSGSALILSLTRATAKPTTYWQTLALNPATGATLWSTNQYMKAAFLTGTGLVLSPDGSTAYVTGYANDTSTAAENFYTVGYDTATGAEVWHARYAGGEHVAYALSISPDGSQVFVTGETFGQVPSAMTTVAYATP